MSERPPPAGVWSSAATRAQLQLLADAVVELVGFQMALINVRDGDEVVVVAVTGVESAQNLATGDHQSPEEILGSRMPLAVLEAELAAATEHWGPLHYLPHDRAPEGDDKLGWVHPTPSAEGPDLWHPLDLLVAPFYDDHGVLRGCLSLDGPIDGRIPGPDRQAALAKYARLTEQHVIATYEQRLVAELRALDEMKDRIVATVSHELRNPIAVALLNLEVATAAGPAPEVAAALGAATRAVRRMDQVVEDLLALARVRARTALPGTTEPVDIAEFVHEAVRRSAGPAAERAVRVGVRAEGPAVIDGDAVLVDRILDNLLSNAIKYNRPGGAVEVAVATADAAVEVIVRDEGIGIDPAEVSGVFGEFVRSSDPRVAAEQGSGLGLSIVEHAVRSLGGAVELSSTPGEGTEVRVRVPVAPA